MSSHVDFFFTAPPPLDQPERFAEELQREIGLHLVAARGRENAWEAELCGLPLRVEHSHDYETDCINLGEYPCRISSRTGSFAGQLNYIREALLAHVAFSIVFIFKASGVIVYDGVAKVSTLEFLNWPAFTGVFDVERDEPFLYADQFARFYQQRPDEV